MNSWGIVPVKELAKSKGRLADALSPAGRLQLSHDLLVRTLRTLRSAGCLTEVAVVSYDQVALQVAQQEGARPLWENQPDGLDSALTLATQVALERGADAMLVVPIDLPLLQPADLETVLALLRSPAAGDRSVLVAPDRRGDGTNLMALRPPGVIQFQFGPGSFWRHRRQCLERAVPFFALVHPHLALDLDLPADLDRLRRVCPSALSL